MRTSRTRIVSAADEARRRLERDLHDGAQQRLVALLLSLRATRQEAASDPALQARIDAAIDELAGALHDLRELARGIHPVSLTRRGLPAALRLAADRAPVPVELSVPTDRYEEAVEATAYYVVVEALTNVAKYARASAASVRIEGVDGRLVVEVEDDGVGGADAARGGGPRGPPPPPPPPRGRPRGGGARGGAPRSRAEPPLGPRGTPAGRGRGPRGPRRAPRAPARARSGRARPGRSRARSAARPRRARGRAPSGRRAARGRPGRASRRGCSERRWP